MVLVASKSQFKRLIASAGGAPGLYILQAEDSTVYVGKSVDLAMRLKNHKTSNKIGYTRALVMLRDQSLSRYLDYGEAKLYISLLGLGYRLEQSQLTSSLAVKRQRLSSLDEEHVTMADGLIKQFLAYSVALGLSRPGAAVLASASMPMPVAVPVSILVPLDTLVPNAPVTANPLPVLVKGNAKRNAKQSLFILRKDGSELRANSAMGVLVQALTEAGLEGVSKLGLRLSGEPLVSRTKSTKYPGASHPSQGWFVMSHSSTQDKVKRLRQVSDAFGLGWDVRLENASCGDGDQART